ncbi:MAG: histidine phosphatase family protein [Clostridiales bacterium]|nr:histidine phosphatase family protein [Clostridiales bacterium]
MILYIIRHADPDYANNTITPFGREEAMALAEWFRDIKLDRIYTSPLGRAVETASYTAEAKDIRPEILPWTQESMDYMPKYSPSCKCDYSFSTDKGVYGFNDFTGTDRMETVEKMIRSSDDFFEQLGYRREGAFYKVLKEENDLRIAVFCHGGFGAAWIGHLLGMAPGLAFRRINLTTTSVTTFVFGNSPDGYILPRLHRLGEICHIRSAGLRINDR